MNEKYSILKHFSIKNGKNKQLLAKLTKVRELSMHQKFEETVKEFFEMFFVCNDQRKCCFNILLYK